MSEILDKQVKEFLLDMKALYPVRFKAATKDNLPYGGNSYASAIQYWQENGSPAEAIFSFEGREVCPLVLEFRLELQRHFGLQILMADEAKAYRKSGKFDRFNVLNNNITKLSDLN